MDQSIIEHFSPEQIAEYQRYTRASFCDPFPRTYQPEFTDKSRLHPAVVAAVDVWLPDANKPGLGIIGPTGIGKTRAAYLAALQYALDNPQKGSDGSLKAPSFWDFNDCRFAEEVSDSYNFDDKEKQQLAKLALSWAREDQLLLLDDLGQAKYTERVQSELYRLIEHRTTEGKPFLWNSNYNAAALLRKFPDPLRGQAILRRLKEFSTIVTVRA